MTKLLELEEAVEHGLFLLPEIPGKLTPLSIPNVSGRLTAISHPLANIVGGARLDQKTAGPTIQQVQDLFTEANKDFSWRVGLNTTPVDLGQRLVAVGFVKQQSLLGLGTMDLGVSIPKNPKFYICEAHTNDVGIVKEIINKGYPVPVEWADILSQAFLLDKTTTGSSIEVYLVFEKASEIPIALGTAFYFPDRPVVMLGGAATLKEFRRQGVYSSLVAHRLERASKKGVKAAVIQAVPTSAQICKTLGFSKICEIEVYIWFQSKSNS